MTGKRQQYGRMPGYLLKAREDEFARWKAAAAASGQTFAEYTREALDAHTDSVEAESGLPDWLKTNTSPD